MANHQSAKKRTRQNIKRYEINRKSFSKIKNNINKFSDLIIAKDKEEIEKSFSLLNSSLSRAMKKGLIKKEFVSRKLSSLSKKINNI